MNYFALVSISSNLLEELNTCFTCFIPHPWRPRDENPRKSVDFQEPDFKALKVFEIGFWSWKVLDFSIEQV